MYEVVRYTDVNNRGTATLLEALIALGERLCFEAEQACFEAEQTSSNPHDVIDE